MENLVQNEISSIWNFIIPIIIYTVIYSIGAVVWYIRLEGKVKSNREVFDMFVAEIYKEFVKTSKEKDEKMEKAMDNLYELVRRVETICNGIDIRTKDQQPKS